MGRPGPAIERDAAMARMRATGATILGIAHEFGVCADTVRKALLRQAGHTGADESVLDDAILEHLRTSSRWSPLDCPAVKRLHATAHAVEMRIRALHAAGRIAFGGAPGRFWYVVA